MFHKSILEYPTGVEFGISENLKVSETLETNKVFLRTVSKTGNPLGNQKRFSKGFRAGMSFQGNGFFLECSDNKLFICTTLAK